MLMNNGDKGGNNVNGQWWKEVMMWMGDGNKGVIMLMCNKWVMMLIGNGDKLVIMLISNGDTA